MNRQPMFLRHRKLQIKKLSKMRRKNIYLLISIQSLSWYNLIIHIFQSENHHQPNPYSLITIWTFLFSSFLKIWVDYMFFSSLSSLNSYPSSPSPNRNLLRRSRFDSPLLNSFYESLELIIIPGHAMEKYMWNSLIYHVFVTKKLILWFLVLSLNVILLIMLMSYN